MEATHNMKPWLWEYALKVIRIHSMDDSHGIKHFTNTVKYVEMILEDYQNVEIIEGMTNEDVRDILVDAAFSHDLIDGKYMDEHKALKELIEVFRKNDYIELHLDILVQIITSMSYSKREKRRRNGLPMINPGPYQLAVAIVVDADQLDAYDPMRCKIFQETKFFSSKFDSIDPEERKKLSDGWIKTILVKRVLRYKDVYMNTEIAKKIAEPMHKMVKEYVDLEYPHTEMYEY